MSDKPIEVGDKLAFEFRGEGYRIETVTQITPTGRIKCGPHDLNADLTVRGREDSFSPWTAERVTPEIRDEIARRKFTGFLHGFKFHELTTETLFAICKLVQSGKIQ